MQIERGRETTIRHVPAHGPHDGTDDPTFELIGPTGEAIASGDATPSEGEWETTSSFGSTSLALDVEGEDPAIPTIGRWYWLSSPTGGKGYAVKVVDAAADGAIEVLTPLRWGGEAVLKGLELEATITDTEAATVRRNCRLVWRYESAGVQHIEAEILDIVATPWALDVSPHDIEAVSPIFAADLGGWVRVIESAEAAIFAWLQSQTIDPDRVIDRRQLKEAAVWRSIALRSFGDVDRYQAASAEYDAALARFLQSRAWVTADDEVDDGDDGDGAPNAAPFRSSTRVGDR